MLPRMLLRIVAAAPLKAECPDTYSGKGGVTSNGFQSGSAVVWSLPSVSACWMAVIGRQKPLEYLPFQARIAASAKPVLS